MRRRPTSRRNSDKMTKKHGLTGKKGNNTKPEYEKRSSRLNIWCHPGDKEAWKEAAELNGETLSTWVNDTLNAKARGIKP